MSLRASKRIGAIATVLWIIIPALFLLSIRDYGLAAVWVAHQVDWRHR